MFSDSNGSIDAGDSAGAEGPPREFLMLLTGESALSRRVHNDAFLHFLRVFGRTLRDLADRAPQLSADVQVGCALLPGGCSLLDVQVFPYELEADFAKRVRQQLSQLQPPPIEGAPVAFTTRLLIGQGAEAPEIAFSFPFSREVPDGWEGSVDDLLLRVARHQLPGGQWSEHASKNGWIQTAVGPVRWWDRARSWCQTVGRQVGLLLSRTGRKSASSEEIVPQSVEELDRLIAQEPDNAALYGMRAELHKEREDFASAIADFNEILRRRPEENQILAARAETHCLAGSYENGLRDLSELIQRNPRHAVALHQRGLIYLELEAWTEAHRDFHAASGLDRRHPGLRIHSARALLGQNKVDEALAQLDEAVRLDPHDEDAFALRAMARRQLPRPPAGGAPPQDLEMIEQDASTAVRINPDDPRHYINRAEARLMRDDFDGAIADCNRCLELDPECSLAFGFRGVARQQLGQDADAIEDCSEALTRNFCSPLVYFARAVAYASLDENEQALTDCEQVLELDPDHGGAHNSRGLIRLKMNEPVEEIIEDFTAAIRCAPQWAQAYANRGNGHRVNEDIEAALDDYERAIDLDAECVTAYLNRGLTYADQDLEDKAIADFDRAIEISSDFAPAYFSRAMARLQQNEPRQALPDFDRVIELDPDSASGYLQRAQVHCHLQDFEAAMEDYDTLIELHPTLGVAYCGRGQVWIEMGELERAGQDYQAAVQCDPEAAEEYLIEQLLQEATHYHRQEQYSDAATKAREALEMSTDAYAAYAIRATALWYNEELVEACEDFVALMDELGNTFFNCSGRGQVLVEMGEFQQALDDLDRAIDLQDGEDPPQIAQAYAARALALAGLERRDESEQCLAETIEFLAEHEVPADECGWIHYYIALRYHLQQDFAAATTEFGKALATDSLPPRKRARAENYSV